MIPKAAHLNVTSLTGYSGGGKKMIAEYEAERTDKALNAPRPYGLALHHKHLPEMAAVTGLDTAPNFVPVVADYYAGMETMIPLDVTALGVSAPQVASALAEYYAGQPMVKVHPLCEGTDGGFWPPTSWRVRTRWKFTAWPTRTAPRCSLSACLTTSARAARARQCSA